VRKIKRYSSFLASELNTENSARSVG
jgi:hypothetical protein